MKQYIILIRENLKKYSLGKNIIHACHNSVIVIKNCLRQNNRVEDWIRNYDQTKILVVCKTLENLLNIEKIANEHLIPFSAIQDKGKYEVGEGTIICGATAPITKMEAELLGLSKLSLFKGKLNRNI